MKRFLIFVLCVLFLSAGLYYAVYHAGVYIGPLNNNSAEEVNIAFRAEGDSFRISNDVTGGDFVVRGVQLSSFIPGHHISDYAPYEEDYLRWMDGIKEMGANTIFVTGIMDDDFYNALYAFNAMHDEPLYLLQGILISDKDASEEGSALDNGIKDKLIDTAKDAVDVLHGRKNIFSSGIEGGGTFRRDVSEWVLGILIDQEFSSDVIAITDSESADAVRYSGKYFSCSDNASAFESMLAEIMDRTAAYEAEKYAAQRPLGFMVEMDWDFREYEEVYARQLAKYASVDPEHIISEDGFKAGRFSSYRLSDLCPDYYNYLTDEFKAEHEAILDEINTEELFGGYTELLNKYHTIPVIAAYSASSSRGADTIGIEPLTEADQGDLLSDISETIESDGLAGGIISNWQDTWSTKSWNTAFAQETSRNYMWHDVQTSAQCTGLIAFDPGESRVCTIDGDPSEWGNNDRFFESNGLSLSAKYDSEGLYILAEGVDRDTKWALPIDVRDGIGSVKCSGITAEFTDPADFLLLIDGTDNTELLVNERYDALRERFLYDIEGRDPFIHFPDKDSSEFVKINMALSNQMLVDILTPETRVLKRLGTYNTGHLVHGISNPSSPEYNSLSDFCFGNNMVEIRIPWLLLNIGEPSSMLAHDDYYDNYGVDMSPIRSVRMGIGHADSADEVDVISMSPFKLKGWKNAPEYSERFKQSYYIIQHEWAN